MITTGSIPDTKGNGGISEALAKRILRGLDLWTSKGHLIEWVDTDRCRVPSQRHDGRFYLVVFGEDGERCRCKDFGVHGREYGACLHTVAALISWAKRVEYRVEKRPELRMVAGEDGMGGQEVFTVYELVEVRAGGAVKRALYRSDDVSEVYWMLFQIENAEWDVDEMRASTEADIAAGVA